MNITSSSVKAPIDIWFEQRRVRLTGFVAGVARTTIRHGVTINGLLPGPFDTDRLRGTIKVRAAAAAHLRRRVQSRNPVHPAGRFGRPKSSA